jgi:hypothetical protein
LQLAMGICISDFLTHDKKDIKCGGDQQSQEDPVGDTVLGHTPDAPAHSQ